MVKRADTPISTYGSGSTFSFFSNVLSDFTVLEIENINAYSQNVN